MTPITRSAASALAGSIVRALASVLSSYVTQSGATHLDFLARNIGERQALYSTLIRHAARVYAKVFISSEDALDETVPLNALISRMRLVAITPVVQAAELAVRTSIHQYTRARSAWDSFTCLFKDRTKLVR